MESRLSNRTSSRLPDVGDVVRSRTSARLVGRSVRGVKLHLLGGSGERFRPLDFYADDVDACSPHDQRWRRPICRSYPRNPTAIRSGGRPALSRLTRPRARPLDRTGCARICRIGQTCPGPIGAGGRARGPSNRTATTADHPIGRSRPAGGRPHGRPPCYIRPSASLPLSLFFSPLQFTLEWIRSGFGWQNPSIGFSSLGEKK